jgi:DNA-binding MarR family transcriptional regulator
MSHVSAPRSSAPSSAVRQLASYRYRLRLSVRRSEKAARGCGVTPLQHLLLLGIAGFTGHGWATISELAEFLQERHNSVVELVNRAAKQRLVYKERDAVDRRLIRVLLASRGQKILEKLVRPQREEPTRIKSLIPASSRILRDSRSSTCKDLDANRF